MGCEVAVVRLSLSHSNASAVHKHGRYRDREVDREQGSATGSDGNHFTLTAQQMAQQPLGAVIAVVADGIVLDMALVFAAIRSRSCLFLSPQASTRAISCMRRLCSKSDSDSVPASLREKYETFDEHKPTVIRDFHEEMYGMQWEEKHREVDDDSFYLYRDRKKPEVRAQSLPTTRGVHGVFDITDLVDALRSEKLVDISVVSVPARAHYCEYLVLATTKSVRHMQAVVQFIRKLHKLKKKADDPHLSLTIGEKVNSTWQVIDMGYIVLHLFQPGVREVYDLESLWCVGPDFDENSARPKYDAVVDFMERQIKFIEQLQPDNKDHDYAHPK